MSFRRTRGTRPVLAAIAIAVGATRVTAQPNPAGPQFQVNVYTLNDQRRPATAVDSEGNFVVVWDSFGSAGTDSSDSSIQARRFAANGTPLASETQMNSFTTGPQSTPVVGIDGAGNFVLAWFSGESSGSDPLSSVQARRFDAQGTPLGAEFQVNTYTTGTQSGAAIDVNPDGSFVVCWQSFGSAGSDMSLRSIQARRYDDGGLPLGDEFQVNVYTTSDQDLPAVAGDPQGNFVVVWTSRGSSGTDTSLTSIQARLYDAAGVPLGPEFQVNSYTTGEQIRPDVARDADGNFLVVWESDGSTGSDWIGTSIQARRFDSGGNPLGVDFQVNDQTWGNQLQPAAAVDPRGTFVVTWRGYEETSYEWAINARRYTTGGMPPGSEFRVDTVDDGIESFPAVRLDLSGNFLVAWESFGSGGTDTSGSSVQARRFDALFRDGFESGDTSRWSGASPARPGPDAAGSSGSWNRL